MAAGSTYTSIATTTLGSAQASYTFTGISSSYTDIILVVDGSESGGSTPELRVGNGSIDTGSNYSYTLMYGTGSSALSGKDASQTSINPAFNPTTNSRYNIIFQFMNYSNTSTYKTVLIRGNDTTGRVVAEVGLWRSTSAINQIRLFDIYSNLNAGTTLTLYGIQCA
jgi:hypothetical protein